MLVQAQGGINDEMGRKRTGAVTEDACLVLAKGLAVQQKGRRSHRHHLAAQAQRRILRPLLVLVDFGELRKRTPGDQWVMYIPSIIALARLHQPARAGVLDCLGGTAIYHIGGLLQNNGCSPSLDGRIGCWLTLYLLFYPIFPQTPLEIR